VRAEFDRWSVVAQLYLRRKFPIPVLKIPSLARSERSALASVALFYNTPNTEGAARARDLVLVPDLSCFVEIVS
jgi:hypothetical protein